MYYPRQAVTRFTLDMSITAIQRSFTVTQGDTNRRWEVTLTDEGKSLEIPDSWVIDLTGKLPESGDDMHAACVAQDGRIVLDFTETPALTSEIGTVALSFDIYSDNGGVLASPKVWLTVAEGTRSFEAPETLEKLSMLQEFIANKHEIEKRMEELEGDNDDIKAQYEAVMKAFAEIVATQPGSVDFNKGVKSANVKLDHKYSGYVTLVIPKDQASDDEAVKNQLSVNSEVQNGEIVFNRNNTSNSAHIEFAFITFKKDSDEESNEAYLLGAKYDATLYNKAQELDGKIGQITASIQGLLNALETIRSEVASNKTNIGGLGERISALETSIGGFGGGIGSFGERISALETRTGALETRISDIEKVPKRIDLTSFASSSQIAYVREIYEKSDGTEITRTTEITRDTDGKITEIRTPDGDIIEVSM